MRIWRPTRRRWPPSNEACDPSGLHGTRDGEGNIHASDRRRSRGQFGLAVGAASLNLFYTPAKLLVAGAGLAFGSVVGLLNGGDVRSAYAVWVPAAGGTFMLKPGHLDGTEPVRFFGRDYADRASSAGSVAEAGGIYEAQYSR